MKQVTSLRPKDSYGEELNKHPGYNTSSGDEAISIADVKEEIASSLQSYFKKETF